MAEYTIFLLCSALFERQIIAESLKDAIDQARDEGCDVFAGDGSECLWVNPSIRFHGGALESCQ